MMIFYVMIFNYFHMQVSIRISKGIPYILHTHKLNLLWGSTRTSITNAF